MSYMRYEAGDELLVNWCETCGLVHFQAGMNCDDNNMEGIGNAHAEHKYLEERRNHSFGSVNYLSLSIY